MATSEGTLGPGAARRSPLRSVLSTTPVVIALGLLFGVPWWTMVGSARWPAPVAATGTAIFAAAAMALPLLKGFGHPRSLDWAVRTGDAILGVIWVLFTWALLGNLLRLALGLAGIDGVVAWRITGVAVAAVSVALMVWGYREAMRVPRIKRIEVPLTRLGPGLDGLTVVLLTDTHYGPINRARWSARVTQAVNALDPDIVCHTGDIADGTVSQRRAQAAPLGDIRARLARAYVTGNHEYFGEAQDWLDHMRELGWDVLHNRHLIVQRGGDRLVLAGVDDVTAERSGRPGHRADLAAALAGVEAGLPVLLLAHQPKQIEQAVAHDVDLQISGHTHGGQIWPFGLLVRLEQPSVHGLTTHGARTQLYTSRGTGFSGPPLRIFGPSEITLITLRRG